MQNYEKSRAKQKNLYFFCRICFTIAGPPSAITLLHFHFLNFQLQFPFCLEEAIKHQSQIALDVRNLLDKQEILLDVYSHIVRIGIAIEH